MYKRQAFIRDNWDDSDLEATVRKIVDGPVFVEKFEQAVPGFSAKAAAYIASIRKEGMEKALSDFLAQNA